MRKLIMSTAQHSANKRRKNVVKELRIAKACRWPKESGKHLDRANKLIKRYR